MTNAQRDFAAAMRARHQIQDAFAATIKKTINATIGVCIIGDGRWTLSGAEDDVSRSVAWLRANVGMQLDSIEYDDELDEWFAYMAPA